MAEILKSFEVKEFLTAGQTSAEGELPLTAFVSRLIEIATGHANRADFGYSRLIEDNCSWVLSRLTAEIDRLPGINETFSLKTWIEDVGRLMTNRCFEMYDEEGRSIARVRSAWCAINIETRRPTDLLTTFPRIIEYVNTELKCPVEVGPKPRAIKEPTRSEAYRFRYSDIDLNRHVNSCRYVGLLTDLWDMHFFDTHRVAAFDLVFHHEALEGETGYIESVETGELEFMTQIRGESAPYCLCKFRFALR